MADPTPVKNVKRQGMTTDEARAFHQVKAQIHAVTEIIGDARNDYKRLFEVHKKDYNALLDKRRVWEKEEQKLSESQSELLNEYKKLLAKWSRLEEKEKNAGSLQPNLQRKRERYVKKRQDLLPKEEALKKRQQEND